MVIHLSSKFSRLLGKLSMVLLLLIGTFYARGQNTDKPNWREMGNNKGFTFYEIQRDFYQYWEGKKPEKGQAYKVFKRWENYMKPRVYPSGNMALPSTTYPNFLQWKRNRPATSRSVTSDWSELGPIAKPTGYDAGKGRVDFVRFDPNNPADIMYVGAPDGGLWKTTNGGTSWTTNTDFLGVIGCADLAIDPTNTQIMYLATGNWENDRRSIGMLKSTDGGLTWNTTSLVWTATDNWKIRKLLMDPTDPLTMLIATDGGVFRTEDGWATHTADDFGGNFPTFYDMEFKPGNPDIVYVVGKEFWKSDDNGVTWTEITSGLPNSADVSRAVLAVTAADADYVYALIGDNDGGYLGTYRSDDSGTTFSLRSSTPNLLQADKNGVGTGGQATHDLAIAVAPDDADLVTVGGINQWQSTDGGVQWDLVSYWLGDDANYPTDGDGPPDYVHADIQDIQYLPGSTTTMFATCDGGISKSTNGGQNWTDISVDLRIAQQTGIALSANSSGIMVTGLQDIGTLKNTSGAWSVINGGDGEDAFIDRTSDMIIVTSNPNGNHAISYDGGLNRDNITGLPDGEWFSPISQDPVNIDVVYAGGRPKLWKTQDLFGDPDCTWTEGTNAPPGTGNILRFVVAPSNNSIIYAIKVDAVSISVDAGDTWTNITGTLPVGSASLSNLAVSNTNPDKVWVTFSGYSNGNKVFKTTTGGTPWTNVSSGLPNLPVNTIVFQNSTADDEVYVGADIGVYYLNNTLSDWESFSTNLPNCAVTDLEIFYPGSKLRASTYGRGAWETDLASALPVELLAFNAQLKGKNTAHLSWTTASEQDNKGFDIEMKYGNNGTFERVGFVAAKGNNGSHNNYSFEQKDLAAGEHYFRLKQIDNDGSFEYSPLRSLLVRVPFKVNISPNPVQHELVVNVLLEESASLSVSLVNEIGQTTELLPSRETAKGNAEFRFDLSNYPAGVYFCVCKTAEGLEETVRIVKK